MSTDQIDRILDELASQRGLLMELSGKVSSLVSTQQGQRAAIELFWAKDWPYMLRRVDVLEEDIKGLARREELTEIAVQLEGVKKAVYGAMALALAATIIVPVVLNWLVQR